MRITESQLRSIVRDEILKEYSFIEALYMSPQGVIPTLMQMASEMFAPSTEERLHDSGDDRIISDYQNFIGTLHMMPEYRVVWENYKLAQRRHASMDPDFDGARVIQHPAGRAFNRLKRKVLSKFDELGQTLSPENRDIWEADVAEQRQVFMKIFSDWEKGKITTGRVLGMLDPKGIVESRKKSGRRLNEAGEMFAGRDLEQMQTTEMGAALETALMDLDDVGCPMDSAAHTTLDSIIDTIEKMRNSPDYSTSMLPPVVNRAIYAVKNCKQIPPAEAIRIAGDLEIALDRSQEIDRY